MTDEIKEYLLHQEKIFKAEIEKTLNKIEFLEEKIKRINEDLGDIKADLKELKNLQLEYIKLEKTIENIPINIKSDIKKEQEDKKYRDVRLWLSIGAIFISLITLFIKFKG